MTGVNWFQRQVTSENALKIREALKEGGKRKIDLSRATGLSRPTVDKYIMMLRRGGEVYERDRVFHLSHRGLSELERLEFLKRLSLAKKPIETDLLRGRVTVTSVRISAEEIGGGLLREVEALSGESVSSCYVCGKCSAGCPISSIMEIQPHQVIRLIQLGQGEEVLGSNTPWLCSSCFTCASRCPRGISLTAIMEALRALKLRKGVDHASPNEIPASLLAEAPQLALVSCFRKLTS